jgi:hypothetical protein
MWRASLVWLLLATGVLPVAAAPNDVRAGAVTDVSVTVYRAPVRERDSLDLNALGGFALVSETRTVSVPAGTSRIRFAGVADGIEPASALLTGLPTGVMEKNHDASVLSPAALVAATVGRDVVLVRTNPKTGEATQVSGTLRSDNEGVVFQSAAGIEALRCSGLPETLDFDTGTDSTPTPTLSVLVRSSKPFTATVRLSYLARGFDWKASYVADVAPDTKTMDLGGWVTLANGNVASFPEARTQVVAGRVNRESGDVEPVDSGGEILAGCWPRGSTSDTPPRPWIRRAEPVWDRLPYYRPQDADILIVAQRRANAAMSMSSPISALPAATAQLVEAEELGDLKLYRVPERTTVTSRQIKQVRLLDRHAVPIELLYSANLAANGESAAQATHELLRTRNDHAHHLGLPLPSGQLSAFVTLDGAPLLVKEIPWSDTTVNEDLEIDLGAAADVEVKSTTRQFLVDSVEAAKLRTLPAAEVVHMTYVDQINQIDLTNARGIPVCVEITLTLPNDVRLIRASILPVTRKGHPTFRVTIPAGEGASITYQTEHVSM